MKVNLNWSIGILLVVMLGWGWKGYGDFVGGIVVAGWGLLWALLAVFSSVCISSH